jgi:hypothetical protein
MNSKGPWVEVVGLTRTSRYYFIAEPPMKFLYLPFAQEQNSRMSLIVETFGDPTEVIELKPAVRVDPIEVVTVDQVVDRVFESGAEQTW